MIDTSILADADLMARAKEAKREKRNEYARKWRRRFKETHGIEPSLYYEAKKLKEAGNE